MKIALATVNQTPLDWGNNVKNILSCIAEAKLKQTDLLLFPELCITGYGCEDLFLATWFTNKALNVLFDEILPQTQGIAISVGLPLLHNKKLYNAACLIQNGEIKGFVCKQHLANDGVHYEPRWFKAWPKKVVSTFHYKHQEFPIGDLVFDFEGIKLAYEICEDAWHEETRPAIAHKTKGVQLILNPSASHFSFGKSKLREELVIQSSLKYNCYYLYANLLGNEAGRIIYDGELIIAGKGKLLTRNNLLSFEPYQLVFQNIDFNLSIENQEIGHIAKQESKEKEFLNASVLGLWDYMRKSHSNGFVLSLSGGADSATCAVLVNEMSKKAKKIIGNEAFEQKYPQILTCAYQSTQNSGEITFNAAKSLADEIGSVFYHLSVDEEVNSFSQKVGEAIGRNLNWQQDDIALQNIQARSRAPMVWMLANIQKALLITTSNRSEGDVGYATMDGDMAGSIAPIAGVDKSYIQQWLHWAENELNYRSLALVNQQAPTAELRPSGNAQTDEKDLMPYKIMQAIERLTIEEKHSPEEIQKILSLQLPDEENLVNYINKFFRLWSINQWKRERTAPSFLLDTFSVDPKSWYRFPILNGGFEGL